MERRTLKNRLAVICTCLAVLCTTLFVGAMEVRAEENWGAFQVKLTTSDSVKAGNDVTFKVSITNTTDKSVKISWINPLYYRDCNNSDKYPGVEFGKLSDNTGNPVYNEDGSLIKKITFASKEKKTFTLSGTIPKTWGKKGQILVVVGSESGKNGYYGQGEYLGKNSSTSDAAALKGTKLTSVKPAKKKVTVKWKKQTKGTTGYQIQYSVKKNFKGAKFKTVNSNKKTSLTLKNLKSKKTYYVRVRTYKKTSGETKYSSWSTAKKVTVK